MVMVIRLIQENIKNIRFPLESLKLKNFFSLCFSLLSILFVAFIVITNIRQLQALHVSISDSFWILLGVILSCISVLINAFAWRQLAYWVSCEDLNIPFIRIYLRTNLLKYIPGGIWHFVQRLRLLKQHISVSKSIACVLLEPLVMAISALLLVPIGGWQSGLSFFCILPCLLLLPRWREIVFSYLRKNKTSQLRTIDPEIVPTATKNYFLESQNKYPFRVVFLEMLFILFRFSGFLCCLKAFSLADYFSLGFWIAAFALSWTLGLIVPGAPGGIGVFEAVLILRVGSSAIEAPLIATLLCYRFVSTISDVLLAISSTIFRKWSY